MELLSLQLCESCVIYQTSGPNEIDTLLELESHLKLLNDTVMQAYHYSLVYIKCNDNYMGPCVRYCGV